MLLRLVLASLRRRFWQLALILAAVLVAAATVSTLAGFSSRSRDRMGSSLAAFGPNLTVRPQVAGPDSLPLTALDRVREVPGVRTAKSAAGLIEVRAEPARLDEVAREIESRVEGIEARPLLKVSESDARVTRRLTRVLVAVSAVSLLLALISVGAATTALLGERRTEVGLLLALGYTGRRVGGFLAAELLTAAVLAGAVGQIAGDVAAGALADRLLGPGPGVFSWSGFAASASVAMLVVGSSLFLALRRIQRLDAARVLRGD
ncbi:MAG TPA: ABC transporter permease [Thermoanaerobaculia bacterium]|nr:ABC transporter permease [Thermoanaerobaculia bacterium]